MMIRCTDFTKVRNRTIAPVAATLPDSGAKTHLVARRKHGDVERISREEAERAQQAAEAMRRERRFDAGFWVGSAVVPGFCDADGRLVVIVVGVHTAGIRLRPQPGSDPEGKALKTVQRFLERLDVEGFEAQYLAILRHDFEN